jgi:TfoX/Sxy family transcriptional regulator of competence genes
MAYDQDLASRIRFALGNIPGMTEKKMFGGVGFLINGNMACGVHGNDMIVRLEPDRYPDATKLANVKPFDMTGRPMKGWLMVEPAGVTTDLELDKWLRMAVDFVHTLPAK